VFTLRVQERARRRQQQSFGYLMAATMACDDGTTLPLSAAVAWRSSLATQVDALDQRWFAILAGGRSSAIFSESAYDARGASSMAVRGHFAICI